MTVVVVSWVLLLLAAFGVNYAHDVIGESRSVQWEVEQHQLRAWARSGIELARATLEITPRIDCPTLAYPGPHNPLAFPQTCGPGRFAVGEAVTTVTGEYWLPGIRDEAARLPVALADSTSLAMLPGMSPHGIEVILQAKETAELHHLPPFNLLIDLDRTSLESAEQFLSRYGDAVNVNSASAEVLRAVGLPAPAVEKILDWRTGPDHIASTPDDTRFRKLDSNSPAIRACAFNSEEAAILAFLFGAGKLTVEPRFFHLAARGWGEQYKGICEIRVVLEKDAKGSTQVVEWTENWLN